MKKQRLQELAGIKKPLNEGYAWERDENGALPTLESSTAKHAESMKEAGLATEAHPMTWQANAKSSDPEVLRAALVAMHNSQDDMTSEDLLGPIEEGYYAIADNLPNLINDIQKAIKVHAKINPKDMDQIEVLRNELNIYMDIQKLTEMSAIGTIL